jgi:molybdenum cofactor cytidylyltransferase
MKITPVVLAAGDSVRMRFPKALLPFRGGTFLTCILRALSEASCESPVIVLGRDAARIEKRIPPGLQRLVNPDPSRGQLSSMRLAISAAGSDTDACMFWPVDQPDVSPCLVAHLVKLFAESGSPITMPVYRGRRGHPAIFARGLFPEFLALPLQEGPKRIVTSRAGDIAFLECDEPGTVTDIDTPADYFALTGMSVEDALNAQRLGGEP